MDKTKEIIAAAKKYLTDFDYILSIYDFTVIYASDRAKELFGVNPSEGETLTLHDLYDIDANQDEQYTLKSFVMAPNSGTQVFTPNVKNLGKVKMTLKYHNFEFESEMFRAGKILKFEAISSPTNKKSK